MFSSISSFLNPSTLTPVVEKSNPTSPSPTPVTEDKATERPPASTPDDAELGVKKKKERSSEAFIIVRPPPTKTNHPLNLQVQLVPPTSRDTNRSSSSRRSIDDSADTNGEPLTRTTSNRSEVSSYSGYSTSQASITSVGSSSASSGRRMIIPLYNLQAHNVMTNVVVDAGTDAKVAKFMRRGLEVIGLAVLEPMEVWAGGIGTGPMMAAPGSARTSLDAPRPTTPGSSAVSLSSSGHPPPTTPQPTPISPPTPTSAQQANGARRFFGKIFKKKDVPSHGSSTNSITSLVQVTSPLLHPDGDRALRTPTKRNSLLVPSFNGPEASPQTPQSAQTPILQPQVLGVQPMLNARTYPPRGRPTAYVWTVSRWLKGSPESLLGGVKGMLLSDRREEPIELESAVTVTFEWIRGKSGEKKRKRAANGTDATETEGATVSRRHSVALTASNSPSMTSLNDGQIPQQKARRKRSSIKGRASMDSQRARSSSPQNRGSIHTNTTTSEAGDDGDESDPEDSETPWTCNVIVKRNPDGGSRIRSQRSASVISPSSGTSSQTLTGLQPSPPQQIKVKVATVSPTPHHPKVVSLLKIPFPLPDIEVANVRLRKRIVTPAGVARPATSSGTPAKSPGIFGNKELGIGKSHSADSEGLILTAEEIKDIVATTGLWLVVREGMGGVGKVGRKGDGWKLRG